ncbi:MAG: glycosyltransferase family A protein [Candidatus Micrarchaeota archaeon]
MVEISVIIPVYNGEKTLKRAIDSVLNQSFKSDNYELVVVNDGSTDRTGKILETYGGRIRTISQRNKGFLEAAITGFHNANGKYIIKLDADDEFDKDILAQMHSVMEKNSNAGFVYSDYYECDATTNKRKLVRTGDNIFNTVAIGIMYRRFVLDEVGFYDKSMVFAEYDLLMRVMKKYKGMHISKPLFTYYRSGSSITANKDFIDKAMAQLREKYGELPIRKY